MGKPYDFKVVEEAVLKLWKDKKVYETIKDRNKSGKPFYFLQGPPYTSGKLHMGQAWNNCLKDRLMRYKRMKGFDVWDRAGYDMHGLPTERKVMEQYKLKTKQDIEKFGIERFATECMKWSVDKVKDMNADLWRMGVWMDYEDPYMPIQNNFISGEWMLVKKAHEQNRLYEGDRTITWCPTCATAMAKHECEYNSLVDDSVFLKFKVKGSKNDHLIIWTTTPWTIPFNLAIMVNPDVEYQTCKVGSENWIVAKALANVFISSVVGKSYEVIDEYKGSKLEGLEYEHVWAGKMPIYKELKKKHPKLHTVVLSEEYVDTSSGTGLVHCAPGCGPEDFEVGYRNNLPPYNNLDEQGVFPEEAGDFAGFVAKKDDKKFIEELKHDGAVVATTKIEHDYPCCERCHSPAIFRKTKQWFFKIEDLKEKMLQANQDSYWVPQAGKNAFNSWLDNLRDNSITKQRYWGTPVPIWRCIKCSSYEVIGSQTELKEKTGKLPENLHKPWIDALTYACECGGVMKRVPDILDVWIDAGSASWNCLYYPERTDLFERYFPADFILEGKDQIRGWFNLLMVASMICFQKPCFKNVFMHGFLTDFEGEKMSKSKGNILSPYELIDKYGADTLRYYTGETRPGVDLNFSWDDVKFKYRNLQVLWNIQNYLLDLTLTYGVCPREINYESLDIEEKYILSRVHSTIQKVTDFYEKYQLNEATIEIETAFLDLSRDYIQFIRDKEDKQIVFDAIYESLFKIIQLLSPSLPFASESIYQTLKSQYDLEEDSIHMTTWPEHNQQYINPTVEEEMRVTKQVLSLILSKREESGVGVRWPLARAEVLVETPSILKRTENLILQQTNIKKLLIAKGDFKVELDTVMTPLLEQEGFAREMARRIQALRKKAGLQKNDRITAVVETDYELGKDLIQELSEKVGATSLQIFKEASGKFDFEDKAEIKQRKFRFLINKN